MVPTFTSDVGQTVGEYTNPMEVASNASPQLHARTKVAGRHQSWACALLRCHSARIGEASLGGTEVAVLLLAILKFQNL